MSWVQCRIYATHEQYESLDTALCVAGAVSITYTDAVDNPIFEPELGTMPLWPDIEVIGLFPAETDTINAYQSISQNLSFSIPSANWEILEEKQWEREWLKYFSPICFAERLWVTPKELSPESIKSDQKVIFLDPGLAFGTGTHPTTALCLEWIALQDWENQSVVDYGCGSGILAIAARKLGARMVFAVDIDPQAIQATGENLSRNDISPASVDIGLAREMSVPQCSRVIANILAQPLIELRETLTDLILPEGLLCLSGITEAQAEPICALYNRSFENIQITTKDGWARITGRKRAHKP